MEESPKPKMTLRQAVAGKWQIPLFVISLVGFVVVLMQLLPDTHEPSFDERYEELQVLSRSNRFQEFYAKAELLRQEVKEGIQLARIHGLVAGTRVTELEQRHELGLDTSSQRSAKFNYENIIKDYREALKRNWIELESPEAVKVFRDLSMSFWCLNNTSQAINCMKKAIDAGDKYNPLLNRKLAQMYLSSRGDDYLSLSLSLLEEMLINEESNPDDRSWAFVRKVDVLIGQDQEQQALRLLNSADQVVRNSRYGDEVEFLRGKALRHSGQSDLADKILRVLLRRMSGRGDIYAQVALELGKINYEQYRDHDARVFYELVVQTQLGKDWYAGGKLGMAECSAMQQRYDQSLVFYQETVDLINQNPNIRSVNSDQVQTSLAVLAGQLELLREYNQALPFLEIEQQIAPPDDIQAALRFARLHWRLANQLVKGIEQAEQGSSKIQGSETNELWVAQQHDLITSHFEIAAEHYLRVSELAVGDDELYGDCLYDAARSYDKAGNSDKSIESWERYVEQRQGQPHWPKGLFYLAQAYQSQGQFEKAIHYYSLLRDNHPTSPSSFDAVVPQARCFLSLDPPDREKADRLLTQMLSDPALTPQATSFRNAMFELGELYYDSERYNKAITILTEAIDRYNNDPELGKSMFLVGDSYRKSGVKLENILLEYAKDPTATVTYERTDNERRRNMRRARDYFNMAVEFYEKIPPNLRTRQDELYLSHSSLYQADSMFDLGQYRQALTLYEYAALRYQLTPTSMMAFVQIINCHVKLGSPDNASSAARRAMLQLDKMSDGDLAKSPINLTRKQWEHWLDWVNQSGLW